MPAPWAEGEKIPWHEPEFSRRMLAEHLSQAHDAASRRLEIIDRHVAWLHGELLRGRPARVLDLGCGPGLYTSRLARLGHECVGIDYGPASIAYAREQAAAEALRCTYVEQDVRTADYGQGYQLAMMLYGEINVFRPEEARAILCRAFQALVAGGVLVLEPHPFAVVRRLGQQPPTWYSAAEGLFSDRPHVCLMNSAWHESQAVAIQRWYIIDATTGEVTRHADSMQAYTDEQYYTLLRDCGFEGVTFYPSLAPVAGDQVPGDLLAITARRA